MARPLLYSSFIYSYITKNTYAYKPKVLNSSSCSHKTSICFEHERTPREINHTLCYEEQQKGSQLKLRQYNGGEVKVKKIVLCVSGCLLLASTQQQLSVFLGE